MDAYARGSLIWKLAGAFALLTGLWVVWYYVVVAGWVMQYTVGSVTGTCFGNPEAYFQAVSAGTDALLWAGLFMLLVVSIVALGIELGTLFVGWVYGTEAVAELGSGAPQWL